MLGLGIILGVVGGGYVSYKNITAHPFIDINHNFSDQADLIVNLRDLKNSLTAINAGLPPNSMSLYLEYLNTGSNTSINKDLKIWPASIAKLPLAIVIMKKVENGDLRLGDLVAITDADRDNRSGNLYQTISGVSFSIDQLLSSLLVDSDNTAQHMLLRQINVNDMQDLISQTGLDELADAQGKVSAKQFTGFLRVLFESSYLQIGNSEKILKLLSQSTFKDFLSQGIPDTVTFAHKYGEDDPTKTYIDSGIVYLPSRPYMLTVMLQGMAARHAESIANYLSILQPVLRCSAITQQ